jgi:glycosyltransferase involved in cell wall biosynthesis
VVLMPQARHPFLYYWFFEKSITKYLNKEKPDLFVSPDGFLSLKYKGKQLPVMHDLNFMHRPEDLPFLVRTYYRHFFPQWASIAHRIATVSEYSKNDIAQTFGVPSERIDVVYNGANEVFEPLNAESAKFIREKYTNGNRFFVYVGSLHKRKNIENMLLAFDQFKKTENNEHKLVIVGNFLFGKGQVGKTLKTLQHKQDVIFTGRLNNEELAEVVGASDALVLVSFFEGFGIPLIEAFYCDVPVITSNQTSLPEVAADAGLVVNPHSVEDISQAMIRIATDPNLRQKLVENARIVRKKFSWDKTAELMWQSISRALETSI